MVPRTFTAAGNFPGPLSMLLAGCLPFWVGNLLALASGYPLHPGVLLLGSVALAALILAAGAARQAFFPEAGLYPAWRLRSSRGLAFACLGLASLLGLILQFQWHTGDLTIPLGGLGVLGGYYSYAPPLAWHRRGLGEAAAALCFGLLPVATGFYLQSGYWVSEELLYGLPLTFAGFNLFLIYGFPDPLKEAPRHSLAARWGPVPAALLYTAGNILIILGLAVLLFFPASPLPFGVALWPLLLLAVINQEIIKRRAYREESRRRWLGRLSLALHLGLGVVFCLMLWQRS